MPRRLFRLIWGDDVEGALRPLLVVGFAGSLAGSACWTFIGIWAIDELDASSAQLGLYFIVAAALSASAGYLGGNVSDHLGRRPVILVGWALTALVPVTWVFVDDFGRAIPLLLLVSCFAPVAMAATQALVADVVPPERHEHAYASLRVANNLGVTLGPPIGGALLVTGQYDVLWVGVALLGTLTAFLAWRLIPHRGAFTPEEPPSRGSFGVIRRDRAFLLFLVSLVLAHLVYFAFEVVLPISAVDSHGLSPAAWGFLVIINPALVTLFQLRLTRRVERFPAAPKLALAMLLMGWPFLLLSLDASIAVMAVVILIFVLGEMLWIPTSQAIVAGLAPADVRGAYMGASASTSSAGFALGPFLGLQIRGEFGDTAMWGFFAAVSVVAAMLGVVACRYAFGIRKARLAAA
ncbi:MAG TPA: MFS transporter [Gaiellaceae bacterium]|nr:MFS transporter [Gaiellaceae bacterium]